MRKQSGVTLLELMIVVAIVGILAAVAVPAYTDHISRGRIARGVEALMEAKVRMEQYYNSNRTYTVAGGTTCPSLFAALFSDTDFDVALSSCSTTTFTITATGKSGMSGYSYTINQNGVKTSSTPTASSSTCWLMSKGATTC